MNIISTETIGRCDSFIDALRAELGGVMAARIIEAEAADFLWESRVRERYLGQHVEVALDDGEGSEEVSHMAFLSILDSRWHAGIALVDGEGCAIDLAWKRSFSSFEEAEFAFIHAR